MPGALSGIRVIDCSRGTAGPRATGILADYGADVVWVEPPGGDPLRERLAVEYSVFNRGKRSATLDVSNELDRDMLLELVCSADVFVESWRPGVADRMGVGYDAVHALAPTVVYGSISGFGVDGPYRDVPGYEALVHAIVGTMGEQVGHREGPIFEGLPFASIGAGYLAAIGILAALYRRHEDGVGRHVETSLLDGAISYLSMMWGDSDAGSPPPQPGSIRLVSGSFRCAEGEYIGVHTGAVGAFGRLMKVLGLDDRIPASETGMDIGVPLTPEQRQLLSTQVHDIFARRPRSEWLDRLLAADICAVPHLHPGEVFDEPQTTHNEMVAVVDDPALGPIEQVAPAAKMARTPGAVRRAAPRAGEHTDEVLAEVTRDSRPSLASRLTQADDRPLLDGLRILDLGAYYAGPYSSRLLADLGADVIKVEPLAGDQLRGLTRPFRSAQAGKRSMAANLKDEELGQARRQLIEWADVVHHNLRPGAAERLGVGYEQVRKVNPRAVYLYAPGWGSSGPNTNRQSFAPMMSGYVGVGFEVAGQFNPPLFPLGNEDPGNGLLGAVGILLALLDRHRSGEGQLIENPQLNATMAHLAHVVRRPDGEVLGAAKLDPLQFGFGPLERLYRTADGWICVVAVKERDLAALDAVLGLGVLNDVRFSSPAARQANEWELADELAAAFEIRSTAEWLKELEAVGVPAAEPKPHNNLAFMHDPENRRTGRVAEVVHPRDGRVREPAVLVRVSGVRTAPHRLAPELGEHTDEILAWLGYSPGAIAALRARGTVR
jgi:crotonobetainyl-CoA:carnitine CoA-transferase CaiB-like acyl-CoA transferase